MGHRRFVYLQAHVQVVLGGIPKTVAILSAIKHKIKNNKLEN